MSPHATPALSRQPAGRPVLLGVAHGSRDPRAAATVGELLARVAALRPGLRVRVAYVELSEPSLDRVVAELAGQPTVVVPLLLGAGYHTRVDIAGRIPPGVPIAPALGPHPLLARALAGRLAEAGWRPGEAIVLAAAGSAEPESVAAAYRTARLLAATTGSPVRTGFVATAHPRLSAVLDRPAAVAPYLLSPGRFATAVAATAGTNTPYAGPVAAPLGAHDALARLVLRRYDEARG